MSQRKFQEPARAVACTGQHPFTLFSLRVAALGLDGATVLAMHAVSAHRGGPNHALIRCPSHDDAHPSCSVHLVTGRARCFACGWTAGDVVALHAALGNFAAMGEALRDLETRTRSALPRLKLTASPHRDQRPSSPACGKQVVVKTWIYRLADGTPAFAIDRVQFRLEDGSWAMDSAKGKPAKVYLPSRADGGRRGMPPPYSHGILRPLLNLPGIQAADFATTIYVVEGEPCVDALASVGLLATTTSGGASNSHKTDWTPLAGRRVVIWPDNDEPGIRYAQEVKTRLQALNPAASVRWVDIDRLGLPQGGDAVDWLARQGRGFCEL